MKRRQSKTANLQPTLRYHSCDRKEIHPLGTTCGIPYKVLIDVIRAKTGIDYPKQSNVPIERLSEYANRRCSIEKRPALNKARRITNIHQAGEQEWEGNIEAWSFTPGKLVFDHSRVASCLFNPHGEIDRTELNIAQYDENGVCIVEPI